MKRLKKLEGDQLAIYEALHDAGLNLVTLSCSER